MNASSRVSLGKLLALVVVLCAGAIAVFVLRPPQKGRAPEKPVATASYLCDGGKTITAAFYKGAPPPAPAPGQPPTPTGSVFLLLSDGRALKLAQTLSADGSRYSNGSPSAQGGESFVFWSKGNGVLVLEDGQEKSFVGCVVVAPEPAGSGLNQAYATSTLGFSIRYPRGYALDGSYRYQEFGPGKDIAGVKFTIPASVAQGTNLAADSYVSVEEIPQARDCVASLFLDHSAAHETVDGGTAYSVASSTGAGAGNRYEETVYALPGTNPCLAVRYLIHYGVIENYPKGAVRAFDQQALVRQFDAIRRTLVVQ